MKTKTTVLTLFFLVVGSATAFSAGAAPPIQPGFGPTHSLIGDRLTLPAQAEPSLLKITAPSGVQLRVEFPAGEQPTVSLVELAEGGSIATGSYKYSLTLLGSDDLNSPPASTHRTSYGVVQWGTANASSDAGTHNDAGWQTKTSATVIDEADNPSLWFLDNTLSISSGTEDDWLFESDNPAVGDGNEDLAIYSFDFIPGDSGYPFVIENESPTNSFYLADTGEIGFGTNSPAANLHIADSAPTLLFEDDFGTTRLWRIAANDTSFDIADVNGLSVPLQVASGAPNNSLVVGTGGVGIGTNAPQGNLHISGASGADLFSGIGPDLVAGPAFNFGYSGSSFGVGSGFFNARPAAGAIAPNPALYFMTNNIDRMMIDRDGDLAVDMDGTFGNTFDPQHPVHAQLSGAHLSAAGVWTNASSRALKDNVEALSLETALAALASLEPVTYNYKAVPDDPQVGFIAEDVPELVATPDRATLAHGEIVGVLTRVVQDLQAKVESQAEELRAERSARRAVLKRLEELEQALE